MAGKRHITCDEMSCYLAILRRFIQFISLESRYQIPSGVEVESLSHKPLKSRFESREKTASEIHQSRARSVTSLAKATPSRLPTRPGRAKRGVCGRSLRGGRTRPRERVKSRSAFDAPENGFCREPLKAPISPPSTAPPPPFAGASSLGSGQKEGIREAGGARRAALLANASLMQRRRRRGVAARKHRGSK